MNRDPENLGKVSSRALTFLVLKLKMLILKFNFFFMNNEVTGIETSMNQIGMKADPLVVSTLNSMKAALGKRVKFSISEAETRVGLAIGEKTQAGSNYRLLVRSEPGDIHEVFPDQFQKIIFE